MSTQTILVTSSYPATQVATTDDAGTLLVNSSTTNNMWVGDTNAIEAGDTLHTVLIPPLGSFTTDGSQDYYAICAAGQSVNVNALPGVTSYSPGTLNISGSVNATVAGNVNVANSPTVEIGNSPAVTISGTPSVAISGTPTIDVAGNVDVIGSGGIFPPGGYSTLLNDTSGHTITNGAGTSYFTAVFNIQNYQSFSLAVQAYCSSQNTGGAPLVCAIVINWYADAGGTILLETDTYWMWLTNSSGNAGLTPFKMGGPAKGAYMQVGFYNYATVNTTPIVVTAINVQGNGRSLSKVNLSQPAPVSGQMNSGLTILSTTHAAFINDASDGIVCSEINNTNMAASATVILPLPIFKGAVYARFQASAALTNSPILASAYQAVNGGPVGGTASPGTLWVPGNTAGTDYETTLQFGCAPTYMVFHSSATATTLSIHIEGNPDQ